MTDSKQHATTADINAILAARKARAEQQGWASIPALPQGASGPGINAPQTASASGPGINAPQKSAAASGPGINAAPTMQAQAVPAPATVPASMTVQAVSDTDLTTFLAAHLPQIQAAAVALATPPFSWVEVLTLGQVVSQAVQAGLPMAKGVEAAQIVQVVTGYAYDHYLVPALPASIKPFAGLLRPLVLQGIEAAYQLAVKRKLSQ